MANSLKKYILKKLGLFRPSSARNINRDVGPLHPSSKDENPQPASRDASSGTASTFRERRASFQLAIQAQQRLPGSPLAAYRDMSASESPRQSARRTLGRHGCLDHGRVSPAKTTDNKMAPVTGHDPGYLHTVRNRRLMKEFREINRQMSRRADPPFEVELVNDCLYEWNVRLFHLDRSSDLFLDMQELRLPCIQLNLSFPENFPFSPPFMRVVTPRIERGFVMEGGAICMELLTPRGWASAYTVEAVIMQFSASVVKGQGRVDRRGKKPRQFNKKLAESSFRGIVKTHEKYGWVTPPLADG